MQKILLFVMLMNVLSVARANVVKGKVSDEKGEGLPFASVYIKGTTKGTTTNLDGFYSLEIAAGNYTLVCQYVGFQKQEKNVEVGEKPLNLDFTLKTTGKDLKELVVKVGEEDPAYAIIRKAIKKRPEYNKEVDAFGASLYNKGVIKLDETSDSKMLLALMGGGGKANNEKTQKEIEEQKGIIHLSESFSEVYYKRPDKLKVKVISSKLSGKSGGYGFSDPIFINLYDNNVSLGEQMSPRGLISPIADNALLSYKYKLLGAYVEDGKLINKIEIIPRRKFEPVFSGIIEIVENEWRIHSIDIFADKDHTLEMMDTVNIRQVFVPVKNMLMVKDQHFKFRIKLMGFGFVGNFINVYTDYDFDAKMNFNKFMKEYDADALKKTKEYWDSNRPIPLDQEEIKDYIKKDSIEKAEKTAKDTVKHKSNDFSGIILRGYSHKLSKTSRFSTSPLISLNSFNWNTAEGFNYNYGFGFTNNPDEFTSMSARVKMRYGVSNEQFNAKLSLKYKYGKTNKTTIRLSGGRYVFQYNNAEPVDPLLNSLYTLLYARNYMKFYQAWFAKGSWQYDMFNGFSFSLGGEWQDRQPLTDRNYYSLRKKKEFTPNFPTEQLLVSEPRHQALVMKVGIAYQPGRKYIKYPERIASLGSKYPTFSANYLKGLRLFNTDVEFDSWNVNVNDEMKLNLWGLFEYKVTVGGFIRKNNVYVTDYTHFNGNQTILASPYLNSFQLSPYYANSNTEPFYTTLHAEHHFQGLLTNKLPLFRKLKWYLVAGTNAYYVERNNNYVEAYAGLENIGWGLMRFVRVDFIAGYNSFVNPVYGIRIGLNSNIISVGSRDED